MLGLFSSPSQSVLFEMAAFFITLFFLAVSNSLKIWIPNTDVNNKLNWDKEDTPRDCDNIHFQPQSEVATYWNLKKLVITGLSLPKTGDIIFPNNINIQFRNKEKCLRSRDMKYVRHRVKGWLDPDNWKSDEQDQWLPHSERVPCAGESVLFPPESTFAVQLPSILVPIGDITFDGETYRGDTWSDFLKTDLGYQLFRGFDDVRSIPWRNDIGCFDNVKCTCGRSSYTIRDGLYKETDTRVFEEAVCLYAMPKCKPSPCYFPVVPEGHCCGVCGAIVKIEDNAKGGLNVSDIKGEVKAEMVQHDPEKKLQSYVGRTKDGYIQIVVVAENSDDTIKSHTIANIIKRKLTAHKLQGRVSSRVSGLRFSNYLFNSVSGVVFGTLVAVLILFVSIYYIYLVLPKKKFPGTGAGNPFLFARFENVVNEENLEIGVEPEASSEPPQAFDNPLYSGKTEPRQEPSKTSSTSDPQLKAGENSQISTGSTTKEYSNPVYTELEKTKDFDEFLGPPQNEEEEFNEVKL